MSLATLVREQTRTSANPCKTCVILAQMTDEDREDFARLAPVAPGEAMARAMSARLGQLGIEESIGAKSIRRHVQEAHA
jgi:hypothetical protein